MVVTAPPSVEAGPTRSGSRRAGITAAFAAATALGVGIGLASGPGDGGARTAGAAGPVPGAGVTSAPAALPRPSPAVEQPGRARLLRLTAQDRMALRHAYYDAYLHGGTGVAARGLRPDDVVIPKGTVFYGEVAGPGPGADAFWAVGPAYLTRPHGDDPGRAVPQVWKRDGAGPWVHVGAGPAGGCAQVPSSLRALWEGSPCAS